MGFQPVCTPKNTRFIFRNTKAATDVGRRCLLARLTCVRLMYTSLALALRASANISGRLSTNPENAAGYR